MNSPKLWKNKFSMHAKKKQAVFKSCRKTEMICFISIDGMEFEASAG